MLQIQNAVGLLDELELMSYKYHALIFEVVFDCFLENVFCHGGVHCRERIQQKYVSILVERPCQT